MAFFCSLSYNSIISDICAIPVCPLPLSSPCCATCSNYSRHQTIHLVEFLEGEEPFQDSILYLELLETPHTHYYMINPRYLYNLLSSGNLEINDILRKLAKEEIIGENPGKHWEKNRLLCKLELKDPAFRIQNKKIESTNEHLKEFELHINELLKLGVIQKSTSRHRSPAFIANKHSEHVKGKSRMVIGYRRLNDNIVDDAYDIPDKLNYSIVFRGVIYLVNLIANQAFGK